MPYALNDTLSYTHLTGSIEITEQQYKDAMSAKMVGRAAYVHDGKLLIETAEKRTVYSTPDGRSKEIAENAPLPEDCTETPRPSVDHVWQDDAWVYVEPEPLTIEQIYALRAAAYADPHAGSDRHFAEAARKRADNDEAGADAATAAGLARVAEIKAEYPLP